MKTTKLTIRGMNCAACVGHTERALRAVPGVKSVTVELQPGRAIVEHDNVDEQELIAAVTEEGYEAEREEV
ncbi:heavy-metal-associated domain-containing protein [Verrucomicrobiota bacterium sgz303538]